MRNRIYYQLTSIFIAFLVVSLPVAHADTLNLIYDKNGNLIYSEVDRLFRTYNSFNQLWKVYDGTSDTYALLDGRVLIKNLLLSVLFRPLKTLRQVDEVFPFLKAEDEGVSFEQMDEIKLVLAWLFHPDGLQIKDNRLIFLEVAPDKLKNVPFDLVLFFFRKLYLVGELFCLGKLLFLDKKEQPAAALAAFENLLSAVLVKGVAPHTLVWHVTSSLLFLAGLPASEARSC